MTETTKRRVVFVDDEPRILQGLRRMLRSQRELWDMSFLEGGQAAWDRIQEGDVDVVVTDMRMPGIDGAELLTRVRERFPHVVRIVLSGHTEMETALRTVSVAHQFLSKPCDPDDVQRVVEGACALQDVLGSPELKACIGEIETLPPLPVTYHRLTTEIAKEDADMGRVAEIVHGDPAIASKLIQLVNSSFFGLARRVSDIRQAVVYLGPNTLKSLVLSLEIFQRMKVSPDVHGFLLEEEQRHAALVGTVASKIVGGDRQRADDAYLAGLLHDIGRLLLASSRPELFNRLADAIDGTRPEEDVERELLGVTHAEIGAYLLGIWGMPVPVAEAVANHHVPSRMAPVGHELCTAVHVAEHLVHRARYGDDHPACSRLDEEFLARVGALERIPEWRETAAAAVARSEDSETVEA